MHDSALEGFVVRQATPSYALHVEQVEGCMAMGEQKYTSQAPFTNAAGTTTAYEAIGVSLTASDVAAFLTSIPHQCSELVTAGMGLMPAADLSRVWYVLLSLTLRCVPSQERSHGRMGRKEKLDLVSIFYVKLDLMSELKKDFFFSFLFPCFLFLSYSEF